MKNKYKLLSLKNEIRIELFSEKKFSNLISQKKNENKKW